jgi:hypothetical protein
VHARGVAPTKGAASGDAASVWLVPPLSRRRLLLSAASAGSAAVLTTRSARAGACARVARIHALGGALPPAGILLVELSPTLAERALATLRFVSDRGESVPARTVLRSEGGRVQALVTPSRALAPATLHHVHVDREPGPDDRWLDDVLGRTAFSTTAHEENGPPVWLAAPSLGTRHRARSHKGDSSDFFDVQLPLASPFAFVCARIETDDRPVAEVIAPVAEGTFSLGRTGCHSMVGAGGPTPVRVTFEAFGRNGLAAPAPGKPLLVSF